ncbi:MAG: putative rab family protein [Streblomastix strix]|uniref:Putative rab family protein n=1 Tax=Streblomastix strix TaxID=222440 RepID=A0A5J4WMQ3_9EUKA|nr:MAG: putative rab family protein [Streblomastix strix]
MTSQLEFSKSHFIKSAISDEELEKMRSLEPVDNRPLFEKLQEQKNKAQQEYDSEHKYRGMASLSKDDVDFFESLENQKGIKETNSRKRDEEEFQRFQKVADQNLQPQLSDEKSSLFHMVNINNTKIKHSAKIDEQNTSTLFDQDIIIRKKRPREDQNEIQWLLAVHQSFGTFNFFFSKIPTMEEEECEYQIKIVVIGDTQVGKSSLMQQFVENTFDEYQPATIGVDFKDRIVRVKDKLTKILIWDTAGQERYRSLTGGYYRVYDISRRSTFDTLGKWLEEARGTIDGGDAVLMLVGNKKEVSTDEGIAFARKNGMLFVEASAKNCIGVEKAFMETVEKIFENPTLIEGCKVEPNDYRGLETSGASNGTIDPAARSQYDQGQQSNCFGIPC